LEVGFKVPASAKAGKLNIPPIVLNGSSEVRFGFISGLIASDGSVSEHRNFIKISTHDRVFAKKIGLLLSILDLEYRFVFGKNIHEVQLRNLRQLEILFHKGWLKQKHRKRVKNKLKAATLVREPQIPVKESGIFELAKKARIAREPRISDRDCISREVARFKLDQLHNRIHMFDHENRVKLEILEKLIQSNLIFSKIVAIEEAAPKTPHVYCIEVENGLPGFIVEGSIFTHNCFGYTGYRNARFGRIECHESITAFSRDILLDSMELAEDSGYSVLHGIVDSLWLAAEDNGHQNKSRAEIRDGYKRLCGKISDRIGIPLELEGVYKWIVFLTNKDTEVGALTRYYGLLDTGEFKVRGLELRQRNTP
jgi:hypothetical protein